MRTVTVEVKVKLVIKADEGIDISEVVNGMDYSFSSTTDGAEIEDTDFHDFEVTGSR